MQRDVLRLVPTHWSDGLNQPEEINRAKDQPFDASPLENRAAKPRVDRPRSSIKVGSMLAACAGLATGLDNLVAEMSDNMDTHGG